MNLRKFVLCLHTILCLAFFVTTAFPFQASGQLEIYYINVQWGTSVLVVGPTGTTILMDGGNTSRGRRDVVPFLESVGLMAEDGLDYIIGSHRHCDHIAGLAEVIEAGYDVRNKIYDNGSDNQNHCVDRFKAAALRTTAGRVEPMPLGQMIDLGEGATAMALVVNGEVIGYERVPGSERDENDRSVGMLIRYRGFDYFFAGDLGGGEDGACTGRRTKSKHTTWEHARY